MELNSQCTAIGLCCCGGGGVRRIKITWFALNLRTLFQNPFGMPARFLLLCFWILDGNWRVIHTCVAGNANTKYETWTGVGDQSPSVFPPSSMASLALTSLFHVAKEEHYATFRAELEAIIHAQDVEDGNLTAMIEGRKMAGAVSKDFEIRHTTVTVKILSSRRLDSQQLYQPLQLHAADYTTYKPTSLQLKQLHPHFDSCRQLFHPTQFFSGYEAIRRADVSVESLATPGGWDAIRIVRLEP